MRTRDEIHTLLASVLAQVRRGEAQATYDFSKLTATRLGENAITQNTVAVSESVSIDIQDGRRRGSAASNRLDPDALAAIVRQAETIAAQAPEDPETVPLPGPQDYGAGVPAHFESTDSLAPERIAADVGVVVARARERGYQASGLFQATTRVSAIANTHRLAGFGQRTHVDYSTTIHGPNGSGKAEQVRNRYDDVDVEHLARTAVENAVLAQDPVEIAPGDYTVIFEPLAVGAFLPYMLWAMSARDAAEGSTPFAGTVGTRRMSDKVSLHLRTDDPELPAPTYGDAGLAVRPTTWVEHGVVRRLYHDRFWAAQQGVDPDPALYPLFMEGEDRSLADLIRLCPRGLLVKNLWYIRYVDERSLLLTGMTRDGLFLVEDGEIVRPVKNLRWNESPLTFLHNVVALSRPQRQGGWGWAKLPAVMSEGFTFTSTTDSV